jgi:hypothetical protein
LKPITYILIVLSAVSIIFTDATLDLKIICVGISAFTIYEVVNYTDRLESDIQILKLIELYALIEYLLAPALYYLIFFGKTDVDAFRPVETTYTDYFLLAIPATALFVIGLRYFNKKNKVFQTRVNSISFTSSTRIAAILTVLGMFFVVFFQSNGSQFIVLGQSVLYIGGLYFYFSNYRYGKLIFYCINCYAIIRGLYSGMLGDAIIWPLFSLPFVLKGVKLNLNFKVISLIAGIFIFSILNEVKIDYRNTTWNSTTYSDDDREGLSAWEKVFNQQDKNMFDPTSTSKYLTLIRRLNHGANVSLVMQRVPNIVPYENGKTIIRDIGAVFIPRIFWKDKPKAGGYDNYMKYAGISNWNVSINIGQLGEAYVNFSKFGAAIVMFFYGFLLAYLYFYLIQFSTTNMSRILWIPFFFTNVYSIESDFFMSFNAIFTSIIFFFALRLFLQAIFQEEI